jgi:ABC-type nitrate/sulfonate/bicarbonate transport system substrate-binding protein
MNSGKGFFVAVLLLIAIGLGAVAYRYWPDGKNQPDNKTNTTDQTLNFPPIEPLKEGQVVEVPFIFWGGDVATFYANGGPETKADDSIFGKHGLKVKLTPGDDFAKQVENYKNGTSPILRGTMSMLGQASEDLTKNPAATPVVFLQLSWSAGDHLVGREPFKDLNDLKGKKIALQEGGPHVGMLNDILRTVKLEWSDIRVVWAKDLSGDKGPADLFRKDATVDACFAVSPEMFELTSAPDTGGITSTGDGTKKSVKGAHVVVSTQHMSRSIADVYACRKDFYDANKPWIDRFVAGYLKAVEELVDVKRKAGGKDKAAEEAYGKTIKLAQTIWGADMALKDLVAKADDVDGLISDATFVGLPGNETFFTSKGFLSGFNFKMQQALALPGDPSKDPAKVNPKPFLAPSLNYAYIRKLGDLHGKLPTQPRFGAEVKIEPEQKIYSFIITFEPDQSNFPEAQYGRDFQSALEQASLFGNAVFAIRGHADPKLLVDRFVQAATTKGILKRSGGSVTYDGKPFDYKNTGLMLDIINKNRDLRYNLSGSGSLVDAVAFLQKLSDDRATKVRQSIQSYSDSHGLIVDKSQLRIQGVGVREAIDGYPTTDAGSARNRRVDFMIIKVPADKVASDEFDL